MEFVTIRPGNLTFMIVTEVAARITKENMAERNAEMRAIHIMVMNAILKEAQILISTPGACCAKYEGGASSAYAGIFDRWGRSVRCRTGIDVVVVVIEGVRTCRPHQLFCLTHQTTPHQVSKQHL